MSKHNGFQYASRALFLPFFFSPPFSLASAIALRPSSSGFFFYLLLFRLFFVAHQAASLSPLLHVLLGQGRFH